MTELSSQQPLPQEGILLHELNHRINNEFAAAISVVSLAAARAGNNEVKAALSGVAELLHQYADVRRVASAIAVGPPIPSAGPKRRYARY